MRCKHLGTIRFFFYYLKFFLAYEEFLDFFSTTFLLSIALEFCISLIHNQELYLEKPSEPSDCFDLYLKFASAPRNGSETY